MCGICGIWDRSGAPVDPVLLTEMRDVIAHRGPDGAGCVMFATRGEDRESFVSPQGVPTRFDLGLATRRLAIIDLNTGDQPMANDDSSIWIAFNGEIYNYRELRTELAAKGHSFRTSSDTEVIIRAYEEYGEQCPRRLNGIFGLAIWDSRKKSLLLSRDVYGVKPLYYRLHGDRLWFGSELKSILADPRVPRELDPDGLNLTLTFRYAPSPWTLLKGIRKLEPGHSLVVTATGARNIRYAPDAVEIDRRTTEAEWLERLRVGEEEAIVRQMVSDVQIAVSLSSGVDSAAVLALMTKNSSGPVSAFTVGFAGKEASSEVGPARTRAERYGAAFHSETITAEDYLGFMPRYLWHLEEPIGNESAAAYFFVARMAQEQGIKVLLTGQGADEAFAGYPRYLEAAHGSLLRLGALPPLPWVLPRILGDRPLGERYARFRYTLGAHNEAERFTRVYSIWTDAEKSDLLSSSALGGADAELPLRIVREHLNRAPEGTPLERMLYVDARTSLADNLFVCGDKMAMAASVEARVPFVDLELMRLAEQIPGNLKLRGLRKNKYIHRRAVSQWVEQDVAKRPQIGFDNAVDIWLRSQLGEQIQRIIGTPGTFTGTYLNTQVIARLAQEHAARQRDHQRVLFLLLSLESWAQVFLGTEAPGG